MCRTTVRHAPTTRARMAHAREKAMQSTDQKIYAAIQILPSRYGFNETCDFYVVHQIHDAFIASMRLEKLEEIKNLILARHGDGVHLTQISHDRTVIVTLTYDPDYFTHDRPLKDFVIWVESLWNKARAHHRRVAVQVRDSSRC